MVSRQEYIDKVYEWKDTPFRHQARVKGLKGGVDCIGLVIGAAIECGLEPGIIAKTRYAAYSHQPDGKMLRAALVDLLDRHPYNRLQAVYEQCLLGDILLFWIENQEYPRHVAVYMGMKEGQPYIMHSYAQLKKVVYQRLDDYYWKERIVEIYRLGELTD